MRCLLKVCLKYHLLFEVFLSILSVTSALIFDQKNKTIVNIAFKNNAVCKGCRFVQIFLKSEDNRLFCFFFRRIIKGEISNRFETKTASRAVAI